MESPHAKCIDRSWIEVSIACARYSTCVSKSRSWIESTRRELARPITTCNPTRRCTRVLYAVVPCSTPKLVRQDPMPDAPKPESLPTEQERIATHAQRLPRFLRERLLSDRPFELRPTDVEDDPFMPRPRPARRMVWLRTVGKLADDPALHRY